jgi:hypothetical protein
MDRDWHQVPNSFADTVLLVENYVLGEIARETELKQLYYHTVDHALAVKRRAKTIFQALNTSLRENYDLIEIERLENSLDLCAVVHDMVQEFSPSPSHQSRQRCFGVSEKATIDKAIEYLQNLNRKLLTDRFNPNIMFTDIDLQLVRESISATICRYDRKNKSIYQPYLYQTQKPLSIAAKIIALADLGTLGMDGIEAYLHESKLIFAEDRPALASIILHPETLTSSELNSQFYREEVEPQLVKMIQSIVTFARERYRRFELEISSFNERDRQILRNKVFHHLNSKTIEKIELLLTNKNRTAIELLTCLTVKNSSR